MGKIKDAKKINFASKYTEFQCNLSILFYIFIDNIGFLL